MQTSLYLSEQLLNNFEHVEVVGRIANIKVTVIFIL